MRYRKSSVRRGRKENISQLQMSTTSMLKKKRQQNINQNMRLYSPPFCPDSFDIKQVSLVKGSLRTDTCSLLYWFTLRIKIKDCQQECSLPPDPLYKHEGSRQEPSIILPVQILGFFKRPFLHIHFSWNKLHTLCTENKDQCMHSQRQQTAL